jgi:NADP-dependent 3-hydroxy acid dehydrogenase YdfG
MTAAQADKWRDVRRRVAVITGGASGIGKGMARHFASEGMHVVLADVEEGPLNATAAEIGAVPVVTDVRDLTSVRRLAEETMGRFGQVDLLCNNAGVGPKCQIVDATADDWRWLIDVNLMGVANGLSAFLPAMMSNPRGAHVVNTASIGGFVTGPGVGLYGATKAAVVAVSESLRLEMMMSGAGVGVTILAPGPVRTGIFNSDRNKPKELSEVHGRNVDLATDPLFADADWLDADRVGPIVLNAIRRGALYVTTHPKLADPVEDRMRAILADFRASGAA